ncbi:MAG TPA: hypothetical protein VG125_00380 [Pirellulales bacterium]|nr:hypothetical protein [Pirellulales bacterium]
MSPLACRGFASSGISPPPRLSGLILYHQRDEFIRRAEADPGDLRQVLDRLPDGRSRRAAAIPDTFFCLSCHRCHTRHM